VEQRSWKASQGAAVANDPTALAFFLEQARQLAAWNALDLYLLEVDGQPIAFEYGYRGKGVHFAHKAGYDEACSAASPGRVLMHGLLEGLHKDPQIQLVDCLGPLDDAMRRWTTRAYPEGRLLLAPPRVHSRLLWRAYRCGASIRGRRRAAGQTPSTLVDGE
jgi:CelD/BcsL family acetyltransferase involved in cellulose biosynthesis